MVKVAEFTGHTSRVLHLAQSPDGTTVVSGAADETLRFWRVFAEATATQKVRAIVRHQSKPTCTWHEPGLASLRQTWLHLQVKPNSSGNSMLRSINIR